MKEELDKLYNALDKAEDPCKSEEHYHHWIPECQDQKLQGDKIFSNFGLGTQVKDGSNQLIINTWFQEHLRHLWTWKSPGSDTKKADYVIINKKFRNAVLHYKIFCCGVNKTLLVTQMN